MMDPLRARKLLSELRFLLDGDRVFLREGGDGGGGDGGDGGGDGGGAPGGAGGDSQEENGGAPGGGDGQPDTLDAEAARKLRSESANLRKRLKEAEQKVADHEKAGLDAQQKAERERDEERTKREELERDARELRAQVAAAAAGVHPKRVAAAVAMLDTDVDRDDAADLERAFKGLKKEHEYLFAVEADGDGKGKKPPPGDAGTRSGTGSDKEPSPGLGRLRDAYANAEKD